MSWSLKLSLFWANFWWEFNSSCWLDTENGLIYAFVVPMACVLLVNITMFIIAIRIAKNSMQKRGESNEKTLALMKGMLYYVIMINVDFIVHTKFFFLYLTFEKYVLMAFVLIRVVFLIVHTGNYMDFWLYLLRSRSWVVSSIVCIT